MSGIQRANRKGKIDNRKYSYDTGSAPDLRHQHQHHHAARGKVVFQFCDRVCCYRRLSCDRRMVPYEQSLSRQRGDDAPAV